MPEILPAGVGKLQMQRKRFSLEFTVTIFLLNVNVKKRVSIGVQEHIALVRRY